MNKEIIKIELSEAWEELKNILSILDKDSLTEVDMEVRIKHILTHIHRGYNYRNATDKEWLGPNEKEYQKNIMPPPGMFD